MNFIKHFECEGKHAFLSASNYHWLRDDEEALKKRWSTWKAAEKGTEFHEHAAWLIENRISLKKTHNTFNMYVNDCIGFRMSTEVVLKYSDICFGTTDAISFRKEHGVQKLRIHDYKSGKTKASMDQLMIYAALFCLEYGPVLGFKPGDIEYELRIYQSDDVVVFEPTVEDILPVIDQLIFANKTIKKFLEQENWHE